MISLGGTIGTGLFLASGASVANAGNILQYAHHSSFLLITFC